MFAFKLYQNKKMRKPWWERNVLDSPSKRNGKSNKFPLYTERARVAEKELYIVYAC